MGKNFEHDPVKAVAAKGEKNLHRRTCSRSTNITIMACVNAAGVQMPPMFVVKGKTPKSLYRFNTQVAPQGSMWTFQTNGWMDDSISERWFNDIFLKNCGPERPQQLILDGHSSHETLGILMKAMEENIHILALPPHTTHALQPLDKTVFGPLNRAYNNACSQFLQENPLNYVNKWSFPGLFAQAWEKGVTPANIESGFRSCGIYPLNSGIIPDTAFGPSEPTDVPLQLPHPTKHQTDDKADSQHHPVISNAQPYTATVVPQVTIQTEEGGPCILLTKSSDDVTGNSLFEECGAPENEYLKNVLDISDPLQLFELIADEAVTMDPVIDESGRDVIIQHAPVIPEESSDKTSEMSNEIENIIAPKSLLKNVQIPKPKRKAITFHRLLTSEEVIREKQHQVEVKAEKEKRKQTNKETHTVLKKIKTENNLKH